MRVQDLDERSDLVAARAVACEFVEQYGDGEIVGGCDADAVMARID